jgi:hypothetical protein
MNLATQEMDNYDHIYKGRLMIVGVILAKNQELPKECIEKMQNSLI